MGHHSHRTVTTLQGVTRLTLKVYRCRNQTCSRFHQPTRPEEEGGWALPHGEFGLDVIALVGALRYQQQRSVPQIHEELMRRGLQVAQRTVTDQLYRYEELVALHLADSLRLKVQLSGQKQVILALDGLQPDVGHEVLWVLRDCCSGEVLVARSLLGATENDLVPLLVEAARICRELDIPIRGVITDGQRSIRSYCLAVRSALTDDGRPPLDADGLKLKERLQNISDSIARVAEKRGLSDELRRLHHLVQAGLAATESLFPAIEQAYTWIYQAAHLLTNAEQHDVDTLKRDYQQLLSTMAQQQDLLGALTPAVAHFQKVTTSYWDGLFACYQVKDLPRTNNGLEQFFGSARHVERRVTGRKRASPSTALPSRSTRLSCFIGTKSLQIKLAVLVFLGLCLCHLLEANIPAHSAWL